MRYSAIDIVRSGEVPVCREQTLMCDFLEDVLKNEDVYFDTEQLKDICPFKNIFPTSFCPGNFFALLYITHYIKAMDSLDSRCLFLLSGAAPERMVIWLEDFALITPVNGVMHYDIDIFATAEDQAAATFNDVYDVFRQQRKEFKGKFYWNKEVIRNLRTKSEIRFRTSNPKTKDGGRPGKVDFDEYHAYEDYKLINVAVTDWGKKSIRDEPS